MSDTQNQLSPARILGMVWSYAPPLILEAAVRNHVFDTLDDGGKTIAEVAAATGASERGLRAVMNALVGFELLAREGDTYSLTPESAAFLVSAKPRFQGGMFRHISRQILPIWLNLADIVRTGRPARAVNDEGTGAEFFKAFVEDLFPMSYGAARALADHLGLRDATAPVSVLDIAAGSGVWSIALAETSPRVAVTAVDWPAVLEVTRRITARQGVADRYRYLAGDLLEVDFGGGYQVATLGHILHSEGPERSRRLLRRVYDALAPGGAIAIAEMIPNDERTGPPQPLIFAVNMLVATEHGDTYTFSELSAWLAEAGFVEPRALEVPSPWPLVLATRPAP